MSTNSGSSDPPANQQQGSGEGAAVGHNKSATDFIKTKFRDGKYWNHFEDFHLPSKINLIKWKTWDADNSKIPSAEELNKELPINPPDLSLLKKPVEPGSGVRVTWIGHSTVLVQMDQISLLTDPIFSQRCSPTQWFGKSRFRDPPCQIVDLPKIDAVVISHNHYDHLDKGSVQQLNDRFGKELKWFVPKGQQWWFDREGCENTVELEWWEEAKLPATDAHPEVTFAFTPTQHWSRRGATDDCTALWGSWCVLGPWQKFFFAGDTGYMKKGFEQIGEKYGPFDLAAIPIGCYEPRHIMEPQHVNPEEAVQIHCDVKARKSLGIHWGTFCLSNEFYLEPPVKVTEAMRAKKLLPEDFFTLSHGDTKHVCDGCNKLD